MHTDPRTPPDLAAADGALDGSPNGSPSWAADQAALVRAHQAEVWRYLRYLGASPEQADDLTQETLLQLLRGKCRDRGTAARAAWLRTVARNFFRRSLRRPPDGMELAAAEAAFVQFARDDGGEGHLAALRQCLDELDGRARAAVRLQYEERRSRDDLGRELGLSPDGVKSLMRRVRTALRACVERRIGT
ncbi:MAG: RNA polymerase sigma factor [Planctomycetota bacterium]